MAPIATYVFLDLETTGLPREECNKTKITELSMVAVKREHMLDTRPGTTPRVQHKLTLCFNPGRLVQPTCTDVTGLSNDLLEHESLFNMDTYNMINLFLNRLTKPVCLIAQNGHGFDFPILKNHVEKLKESFPSDLLCADCYHAFHDIMEAMKKVNVQETLKGVTAKDIKTNPHDETDQIITNIMEMVNEATPKELEATTTVNTPRNDLYMITNSLPMKMVNETTPKKPETMAVGNKTTPKQPEAQTAIQTAIKHPNKVVKARRRFPWSEGSRPAESYKLKDIYERLLNRPAVDAHRAENDCLLALECSVVLAKDFVAWVEDNNMPFADVKPMTIGVPLGLLVLTGALWGCSNPFVRAGTRGLRGVRARTRIGQARAELAFLLGNWRYVIPWLVNQAGSLSYLAAVQRAPLSLAVPAANGLAFACTALVGAAAGVEEPLDAGSILGVVLIVAGTALCCWDKT